jgi:hypothetical protein
MLKLYTSERIFPIEIGCLKVAYILARCPLNGYFLFVNMFIPYHYVEISDDALQLLEPTECFLRIILVLSENHELPEGDLLFVHLLRHYPHKHASQQH